MSNATHVRILSMQSAAKQNKDRAALYLHMYCCIKFKVAQNAQNVHTDIAVLQGNSPRFVEQTRFVP
jgi:hypothetical protein